MKSNESAVLVDLKIDRNMYEFLSALANVRGKSVVVRHLPFSSFSRELYHIRRRLWENSGQ